MTLWEFRHLNELQVNKRGLSKLLDLFHSPTQKAVRIHLDPFIDMASHETLFPFMHSNLQILSTESVDAELESLLIKCSFWSAAALLAVTFICAHCMRNCLREDLGQDLPFPCSSLPTVRWVWVCSLPLARICELCSQKAWECRNASPVSLCLPRACICKANAVPHSG